MPYITQQPRSITNPSDKYTVVDYDAWVKHAFDGGAAPAVESEWRHYHEALKRRDELNNGTPSTVE